MVDRQSLTSGQDDEDEESREDEDEEKEERIKGARRGLDLVKIEHNE